MANIDLEDLYKQTQKVGVIEEDTSTGNNVDLDSLYKDSKNGIIIDTQSQPTQQQKPSLLREFGKANEQLSAGMRANLQGRSFQSGFENPASVPRFQDTMPQSAMNLVSKIPGVTNLPSGIQEQVLATAGYPARLAGFATDALTNPIDIASGIVGSRAIQKGGELLSNVKLPSIPSIKFGGEKAMKNIAIKTADDMLAVDRSFQKAYNNIVTDKLVPQKIKGNLSKTVSDALLKTAPDSGVNSYVDDLTPTFQSANLTMRDLHNLKGELYKRMKSAPGTAKNAISNIYDAVNDALSSKELGSKAYLDVTSNFRTFSRKAEGYLEKLIRDAEGYLTGKKLTSQTLEKSGLTLEQKRAFKTLANFSGSENITPEIQALLRGEKTTDILKKILPLIAYGGATTGGGYLGYRLVKPFFE